VIQRADAGLRRGSSGSTDDILRSVAYLRPMPACSSSGQLFGAGAGMEYGRDHS
jgi:hypothetical protein